MESITNSSLERVKGIGVKTLQFAVCAGVLSILAYAASEDVRRVADKNILNPLIEKALGIDPNMDTDHAPYLPSLF
jgi:hypothetical protein